PFIMSYGIDAALGMPKPFMLSPKPSKTFLSNLPGFSFQSMTSLTFSPNHFFPFASVSSALLTTALLPLTTFPCTSSSSLLASNNLLPNKLSSFLCFLGLEPPLPNISQPVVPLANLGNVPLENVGLFALNIKCVCAPFITDEPLGKNAVVSLLSLIGILPLGYFICLSLYTH